MRAPTPLAEQLSWWRQALDALTAGSSLTARSDQPQPGFYRTRLTRGGPWVPARIELVQDIDYDDAIEKLIRKWEKENPD